MRSRDEERARRQVAVLREEIWRAGERSRWLRARLPRSLGVLLAAMPLALGVWLSPVFGDLSLGVMAALLGWLLAGAAAVAGAAGCLAVERLYRAATRRRIRRRLRELPPAGRVQALVPFRGQERGKDAGWRRCRRGG